MVEPSLQVRSSGLLDGTDSGIVASDGAPNGSIAETKLRAGKVGTVGEVVVESVENGRDVLERAGGGQKGGKRRERNLDYFSIITPMRYGPYWLTSLPSIPFSSSARTFSAPTTSP